MNDVGYKITYDIVLPFVHYFENIMGNIFFA